ncbi:MAG: undecaprenyldiphospho-muramoylpentapeptide beta-N-acetylglucosaminyltransferase [Candidatus Kryptoniota bacterium]
MTVRVLFAGGGTGGHLFPAIAIAERLRDFSDVEIWFVGTKGKIESRVVPQLGYTFKSIWIGGLVRGMKLSNLLIPIKVIVSILQSLKLVMTFRPHAVVGTGGYVAGPVCAAAVMTRTPIILQEHNSYPGIVTRIFAPFAREVHIAFEASRKYFRNQKNLFLTGSPVRKLSRFSREESLSYFGLSTERKTLFVTGGSAGAVGLNSAVLKVVDELIEKNYQLIWQTGSIDFDRVRSSQEKHLDFVSVNKFIDKIEYAYSAADVVVCRAGATTIAELIQFELPALIVPYPYAAANHQVENAKALTECNAAVMVEENQIEEKFRTELINLISNPEKLIEMRENLKKLQKGDPALTIAKSVIKISGENAKGF